MQNKLFLTFAALFAIALCQDDPIVPIPDSVKDEIRSRVDSGSNPSIAIAAFDKGEVDVFVYGTQVNELGFPPLCAYFPQNEQYYFIY